MSVKATLRFLRVPPRKARLVIDLVRGKKLDEALQIAKFTRKKTAIPLYKLLKSAEANADVKGDVDVDNLYVKTVKVDEGPTIKRMMTRAQGRATVTRKRTSHITVVLDER